MAILGYGNVTPGEDWPDGPRGLEGGFVLHGLYHSIFKKTLETPKE
jgi:hypothetical protein